MSSMSTRAVNNVYSTRLPAKKKISPNYVRFQFCNVFCSFFLFLVVFLFYVHVFQQRYSLSLPPSGYLYHHALKQELDVNQTCRYPNLDPFDPSIRSYLSDASPIFCRPRQYALTYLDDDGWLRINETALQDSGYRWTSLHCEYCDLIRPPDDDDSVNCSTPKKLERQGALMTAEFVAVQCTNFIRLKVYSNLHAHVFQKVFNENHKSSPSDSGSGSGGGSGSKKFSIQLLIIDSMSRSNFIRQLPKTYVYLVRDLGATVLRGMTKVGDNTFPNLSAVLTGKQVYCYPELEEVLGCGVAKPAYYDDWPLIWYNFSQAGYSTLFAEDQPHLGLFNYMDHGFKQQPTNHYLRPFWLQLESSSLHRMSSNLCFGDVPKHMVLLDYIRRFLKTYKDSPHFGFVIFSEINHDFMNQVGAMDDDILTFLQNNNHNGYFNDTVLIIMGDHGHRMDSITQTHIGSLESRLPFAAVHLPDTFIQQFPEAVANLRINGGRLTSMLDFHHTLLDLLQLAQGSIQDVGVNVQSQGGTSLFGPIPLTRTCIQAGIPNQFCACDDEIPISTQHPAVDKAANAMLTAINKLIESKTNLCALLTLQRIHSAIFLSSSGRRREDSGQFLETIWSRGRQLRLRVTAETMPGGGLFQGVIVLSKDEPPEVMSGINRVNRYGDQADCLLESKDLRMYCYCIGQ